MRRALLLAACLGLAACGNQQRLHPPANASLPPKAATAPAVRTADELLKQPASERPSRSDELLTKSQPRPDDPFDQPPK
jgi:ABC-type glycerol-3-phosphate transport system substrate-binding protein